MKNYETLMIRLFSFIIAFRHFQLRFHHPFETKKKPPRKKKENRFIFH